MASADLLLVLFSFILASIDVQTSGEQKNHFSFRPTGSSSNNTSVNYSHSSFRSNYQTNLILSSAASEASLISILRMSSRPGRRTKATVVPEIMMDLYWEKAWTERGNEDTGYGWNRISSRNRTRPVRHIKADVVRSFFDESSTKIKDLELSHDKESFYFFNLTELSKSTNEILKRVDIIVHHPCNSINNNNDRKHDYRVRIEVFQILRTRPDTIRRLLDSRIILAPRCGRWEAMDVHKAATQWIRNQASNLGLFLKVVQLEQEAGMQGATILPSHRTSKRATSRTVGDHHQHHHPFLITYSDDSSKSSRSKPEEAKTKTKKTHHRKSKHRKRSAGTKESNSAAAARNKKRGPQTVDNCRRHSLYVDFSDIGWNDWIVAPVGYYAYYCHGDCPIFLHDHVNYTNHAVIQSLRHSISPRTVPKPCCVPTKLSSIPMLYVDSASKVVLKNYEDMVVEACGCR